MSRDEGGPFVVQSAEGSVIISASASAPSGHYDHQSDEGVCDVYIGGWPAHVRLTTNVYGKGVNAIIQTPGDQWISIVASAKTTTRQAQLLRAVRSARISSAWGARYE